MKCVIGGSHLKVFGRAIHAIARISDEFWFDPIEKGLALRSVNSSRSAYAYVFFSSMFFQHYCWTAVSRAHQKENQSSLPCKLIIKSVLPVFRCANMLERNVEKCSIYTNINDHHITFQLLCKHGVVKTYNLTFQECDPLQAVFAKHMCPNVLKVHSRLLSDIMVHFPTSQEEITLSIAPMKVCFKSYTDEDTDFSKTMLTEIQLSPDEFDYFQVGIDAEVTFCLKELRGLLTFSEATGVPVSIHFGISGRYILEDTRRELLPLQPCSQVLSAGYSLSIQQEQPIAFSIEDMVLEASFILATLSELKETASQQAPCCSQQQESSKVCMGKTEKTSTDKKHSTAAASKKPQWSRNAPNMESAEPASPWAKQEIEDIPRVTQRDKTGIEGTATREAEDLGMLEEEATASHYQKFHSLFFGAVSCKEKDAIGHTFHSLATASDTEDFGNVQSSPVL